MEKNSNNDAKLEKNKESSGNEKLVEEEAPEGGWGWVVTFAFIIVWVMYKSDHFQNISRLII